MAEEEVEGQPEAVEIVPDIQKVYIKDYGNLTLEIKGSNETGVIAYSHKREEQLFIPWTSIIFLSKVEGEQSDEFRGK